ncbi:tape measure protein [Companilactobacillus metriopterae]|uniref:tape measure protein n=1 Tax=Companilactobacillus metriopterae TaxID=1909267 RepID=UPI00100BA856|nr:tape measure protein [Companilactobacillus metriopterae]
MAGRIKGITIEIDGNTKGLDKALSNVNSEARQASSELRDVNRMLKFDPSSIELVVQKQSLLSKQIQNTSEKLQTLKNAQSQVDAEFKKGTIGEEQYRGFKREIVETENQLKGYKSQLESTKNSEAGLASALSKAENEFGKNSKEASELRAKLSSVKSEMDNVGRSGNGISSAGDHFTKLKNKVDDSSGSVGRFKQAFSFGTVLSAAQSVFTTLTGGIGSIVSQAVESEDALSKFKSTMEFAGFNDSQIKKARISMKDYADKTVYDLDTVANTTAQLASNGVPHFTELTQAAGNLNAVAGGNADTFKSVSMVLTQTAGAGKLTTENWNQLADAIPGASGPIQEALKKNGAFTGNFRDAMAQGQITSDEFNQALMELGNKPVAVEAAKSTETFEGAIGNLEANAVSGVQNIIEAFGSGSLTNGINQLSDIVTKALDQVKNLVNFLKDNKEAVKIFAETVLILVAAFTAMSAINSITSTVKDFFNLILDNPIGAIIVVIGLLVAALVYFFTQTKTGQEIVKNVVKAIQDAWQGLKDFLDPLFSAIGEVAKNIWNGIVDTVKPVIEAIKVAWSGLKSAIEPIIQSIVNVIKAIFDGLKLYWDVYWSVFGPIVTTVWNVIQTVITTVINVIVIIIQTALGIISQIWQAGWAVLGPIVSAVFTIISTVISTVFNVIAGIIRTIIDVIKGDWSGAWNEIKNIVTTVWNAIKTVIDTVIHVIASIISSEWNLIKGITSTIWNGIKAVITTIWNGIKAVITSVVNGIKTVVTGVWNAIKSVTSSVFNAVKGVVTSIWNGIKSVINGVVNGVKTLVTNGWNGVKSITQSVWSGLKALMVNPVEAAKKTISGIVDAIKGFFKNMHLSIPKIQMPPMPHFSMNGGFSFNPPSVPSIGVKWYAKGAIFKKPALFNGPTGLSGAGEAGPEAMLPLNKSTLGTIGDKISKNMQNFAQPINITVNVTGGDNPQELGNTVAEAIEAKMRQMFNSESSAFGGGHLA